MAKFVGTAELIITPEKSVLLVDGEEFPFHVAADDIEVVSQPDSMPFVRVSVLAGSVQVRADLGAASPKNQDSEPAVAPADPPVSQPWAGMVKGGRITLYIGAPEPPERIKVLKEVGAHAFPYLVRSGDGWEWSSEPKVRAEGEGDTWKSWFGHEVSYLNHPFEVVEIDD